MEHKGFQELVADAKKKITEIFPIDAASKTKSSDAVIVDVRENDEWDDEHIPDAVHMSRGMLELEIEDKFPDRNTTIICHCGGGGRSALAAESLQKMGYKNVRSMTGGFKAWKAAEALLREFSSQATSGAPATPRSARRRLYLSTAANKHRLDSS